MGWIFDCLIVVATSILLVLISKKILNDEKDHDPIAYAAISFFLVAVYASIFYLISGIHISDFSNLISLKVLPVFSFDMIVYAIAPSLYWRVLKKLPASEVQILYTLVGMFALFIATLIGTEAFHINRLLGGFLIISAVVLVTQQKGKWKLGKYALMLIIATVIYGAASVADNYIITRSYFTIPFFEIVQFAIPALLLFFVNPQTIRRVGSLVRHTVTIRTMLVTSFFFFLNYLFIFKAYQDGGAASQVNLFFSIETVIMVIAAAIFLKERKRLGMKIIASILATLGVILLAQ